MALKDSLKKQLNNAKITATKAKDAAVSFSDKITPVIEDKTLKQKQQTLTMIIRQTSVRLLKPQALPQQHPE